jgi:hypothetical protein
VYQPGKPDQSAVIERFNRSFRCELLDAHIFESLVDERDIAIACCEIGPRDSLGACYQGSREKIVAEPNREMPT